MGSVRRINRRSLERTLAFLLLVSITPWPTALAAADADRGALARPAAIVYAATMMMDLSFAWSWQHLAHHPELVSEPARPGLSIGCRRATRGGLVFLVAIDIVCVSAYASFAIDAASGSTSPER